MHVAPAELVTTENQGSGMNGILLVGIRDGDSHCEVAKRTSGVSRYNLIQRCKRINREIK
jgi:hypothetical protein